MRGKDLQWMDGTQACAGSSIDPDWFFVEDHKEQLYVTAICHDCPLINDCAEYALHNRVDGVWGGMTERAIAALRKERGIIPKNISGDVYLSELLGENYRRQAYSKPGR